MPDRVGPVAQHVDPEAERRAVDHDSKAAEVTTGIGAPILTGYAVRDRLVLRAVQRRAGNAAARSLVPLCVARPALQRQVPPVVQRQNPPTDDATKKLIEDEDRAWTVAKGKVGVPALFVWHEDPAVAKTLHGKEAEASTLTVAGIVDRNGGEPKRKGFDSPGAAAGFASVQGPAIVFKQDRFYFVATLSGGSLVRDKAWKVESRTAVEVAIGSDSLRYALNEVLLLPSQDYAAKFVDPARAEPTDAAGMRSVAGVKSDEDIAAETAEAQQARAKGEAPPDPRRPERTRIPPEKQEAFIAGYFKARAMELLGSNLRQAQKLKEDFKPQATGESKGVSANAKALIDSTREQGPAFREILEKEALAERYLELVTQSRSFSTSASKVIVGGKEMIISLAQHELKTQIDEVKQEKNQVLSRYPMLALMVDQERKAPDELSAPKKAAYGAAGAARSVGENIERLWKSEIDKPTLYGRNQYDASSFGKGASDDDLRKEFFDKIAAVETAVREARTKVLGESPGFLYGMAPLRSMVLADLAGNPELKAKADELLKSHDTWSLVLNILGAAIEFGLLFVPGVGPLLSAVAGLPMAAWQANTSLEQWNISKASVDPTKALVDQQEASDTLFWDTVFLAASAADFGAEVAGSLAKGGKAMSEAEKTAKEMGARPYRPEVKRRRLVREAEEQKFWQPKDAPAVAGAFKKPGKPEPAKLSEGFTGQLATLGLSVDVKGVVTGDSPASILGAAKRSWTRLKSVLLGGETAADKAMGAYLMGGMVEYRHNASHAILSQCLDEVKAKYYKPGEQMLDVVEPTGSVSLTSDMDFIVKGPHASEIVELFNKRFRQRIVDCESAVAFDTNVYTRPAFLDTPFDLPGGPSSKLDPVRDRALIARQEDMWKEFSSRARSGATGTDGAAKSANIDVILAEAERLYPTDFRARMAHVNNFNQEAASHIKAADTMLAKGKDGVAEWAAYKESVLKATPPGNRAHQVAVLQEAEARTLSYQEQVLAQLNEGRPKSQWITKEQMAEDLAKGAGTDGYERIVAARTRLYEKKLGKVSEEQKLYEKTRKEFEALRKVWESGKATPDQQAELLRLQSELHARSTNVGASQSEALYFASEAHQAQGTFLLIVQNGQKAKNVMENPAYGAILSAQARDACFELLGFVVAHSGANIDDALGAAKNLERANLAYMSHPLAKGGSPAVLGLAGRVVAAKKAGPDEALKVITGHYGLPKDAALKAFARDVQAAGAQVRGQMARVSGQPVKEIEEAWMRAVESGHAATLLMYASLAASKAGAADRATH